MHRRAGNVGQRREPTLSEPFVSEGSGPLDRWAANDSVRRMVRPIRTYTATGDRSRPQAERPPDALDVGFRRLPRGSSCVRRGTGVQGRTRSSDFCAARICAIIGVMATRTPPRLARRVRPLHVPRRGRRGGVDRPRPSGTSSITACWSRVAASATPCDRCSVVAATQRRSSARVSSCCAHSASTGCS